MQTVKIKTKRQATADKKYHVKIRNFLLYSFGDECLFCDETDKTKLEFAHKGKNHFNGMGRGQYQRLINILQNPQNYFLLCELCHDEFDRTGMIRGYE